MELFCFFIEPSILTASDGVEICAAMVLYNIAVAQLRRAEQNPCVSTQRRKYSQARTLLLRATDVLQEPIEKLSRLEHDEVEFVRLTNVILGVLNGFYHVKDSEESDETVSSRVRTHLLDVAEWIRWARKELYKCAEQQCAPAA